MLNYKEINGRPCRIMWTQRDPALRKSGVGNVFVKGLPAEAQSSDLMDVFSMFGNILSCKVGEGTDRALHGEDTVGEGSPPV